MQRAGLLAVWRLAVAPKNRLHLAEHGTPLERAAVTFVQFDGEPTFVGVPAAGRRAAEQAAAEAALAFVFDRTLAEP